jgi:hypothetical protein
MKKIILLFFVCACSLSSFAQSKIDAESIFKMQLFLDKEIVTFRGMDTIATKGDSLYKAYSEAFTVKLDTLKITGNFDYTMSVYAPHFTFYKLNKKSSIRTQNENELQFFSVFGRENKIAINNRTGRSYRIVGFNACDFLGFLSDYLEEYNNENKNKINVRQFLRNYHVEGVDFKCLYKGLISNMVDKKKYPCLKRPSDPVVIGAQQTSSN